MGADDFRLPDAAAASGVERLSETPDLNPDARKDHSHVLKKRRRRKVLDPDTKGTEDSVVRTGSTATPERGRLIDIRV